MRRAVILSRVFLAAVFVFAAVPKILAPHEFALAVFRYQILPYSLVNGMALFLPWIELVAAVAILFPRFGGGAALVIAGMLAVFSVAISVDLARGIDISCGCFSVDPNAGRIGWWEVVRDLALMAVAGLVLWDGLKRPRSMQG